MKILAASYRFSDSVLALLATFIPKGVGPESTIGICCNAFQYFGARRLIGAFKAKTFRSMGYQTVYVDLARLSTAQLDELMQSFHNLYVSYGDTRCLLNRWERSGHGSALLAHIQQNNGTLIGESAGTILFGASIETADYLGDKQDVQPPTLNGLNLFSNRKSFFVHVTSKNQDKVSNAVSGMPDCKIIPLSDGETYVQYADGKEEKIA